MGLAISKELGATLELLATGKTDVVINNAFNFGQCSVRLINFHDARVTDLKLHGDDFKVLAPDSGLNIQKFTQEQAWVLQERGKPVLAFAAVRRIGYGSIDIVGVNVYPSREKVYFCDRPIINNESVMGGVILHRLEQHNRLAIVKAKGLYTLTPALRADF